MPGESTQQKRARKASGKAAKTLSAAEQEFLASPLYKYLEGIVGRVGEQPEALGDEEVALLNQRAVSDAFRSATSFLKQLQARSVTGAGFRSGTTRRGELEVASRFGEQVAQGGREAVLQQALSRLPALAQSAAILEGVANLRYQFPRDVANAQLGQASVIAQLAGQPTPASGILNFISGLGEGAATAAAGGAFGTLGKQGG